MHGCGQQAKFIKWTKNSFVTLSKMGVALDGEVQCYNRLLVRALLGSRFTLKNISPDIYQWCVKTGLKSWALGCELIEPMIQEIPELKVPKSWIKKYMASYQYVT